MKELRLRDDSFYSFLSLKSTLIIQGNCDAKQP